MTKEKAIKSNVEMHNFWFVELKIEQREALEQPVGKNSFLRLTETSGRKQ